MTGTVTGVEGASAAVSSRFQVTTATDFKPSQATALSKTRNDKELEKPACEAFATAGGSSIVYLSIGDWQTLEPRASPSSQTEEANIARVKVDLPKQLPSRLTTLQKACTAAVFDANPAACPAASIVASAKAITPILPVPLEGPAYFVSHGNEAFPQLILVLQGYGITIDLVGDTFITRLSRFCALDLILISPSPSVSVGAVAPPR